MKEYLFVFCSLILFSCTDTHENNNYGLKELHKETDSLKEEINKLKKQVADTGSSLVKDTIKVLKKSDSAEIPSEQKKTITTNRRSHSGQTVRKKTDTTFYFYINTKKISARIDPRDADQKRHMSFYDLSGNITFEQEDVYKSYSISTELKEFHMNGAVKRIVIHYNPGASLHWYETNITFDTDNVPAWKEEITYPLTLEGMMGNKFYWNKNEKQWVRQDVVIEQPLQK